MGEKTEVVWAVGANAKGYEFETAYAQAGVGVTVVVASVDVTGGLHDDSPVVTTVSIVSALYWGDEDPEDHRGHPVLGLDALCTKTGKTVEELGAEFGGILNDRISTLAEMMADAVGDALGNS